jgi:glycerophosphoryl diester phosphodiesterase
MKVLLSFAPWISQCLRPMKRLIPLKSFAVFALVCVNTPCSAVEFISHRGESVDAPENTLAAFRLAWERGSDAIELDIHLSADNKVIVCHDSTLKRTTGADGKICEMPLAEIQKRDAGSFKNPRFSGEPIPELSTVLEHMPRGRCFIEIKSGEDVVPALAETIQKSKTPRSQLVLISFNEKALKKAHDLLPDLKAYLIAATSKNPDTHEMKPDLDALIARAKHNGFSGLDLGFSAALTPEIIQKIKSEGLECYVWTVNKTESAREALKMGVDGITSDRAASLKEELLSNTPKP